MIDLVAASAMLERGDLAGAEAMLADAPGADEADRLELRGHIATARKDRNGGLAVLEEALALRIRRHGATGEQAAQGHAALANHLTCLGEGEAALAHAVRAVAASPSPRWLVARAHAERVAGDLTSAAASYKKALAKLEGAERMDPLRGLGHVYRFQGDAKRARKRYREALELVADKRSYDAAALISSIGAVTADLGEHDQGIALLEQALAIFIEVCGELHGDVAICLNNLGLALGNVDMYRAAAALQYAVAIGEHVHAALPEHGTAFANLAYFCSELGKPAAALAYAERGLAIQERIHGPTHIDVLLGHANLAHYEKERGRDDLALARALNLAAHQAVLAGADQEVAAAILFSTGQLVLDLGNEVARAAELFTASFAMRARLRRDDDEVILNTARNAAARLFDAGATDDALAFLRYARATCEHAAFKDELGERIKAVRKNQRALVVADTELDD